MDADPVVNLIIVVWPGSTFRVNPLDPAVRRTHIFLLSMSINTIEIV